MERIKYHNEMAKISLFLQERWKFYLIILILAIGYLSLIYFITSPPKTFNCSEEFNKKNVDGLNVSQFESASFACYKITENSFEVLYDTDEEYFYLIRCKKDLPNCTIVQKATLNFGVNA